MKQLFTVALLFWAKMVFCQFTAGNLVVSRVGDGTPITNAASQVQLVEYTLAGTATGYTVTLPTTSGGAGARACTNSGSSTTEGFLTLSTNGEYLIHTGYDAVVGTAAPNTSTSDFNRVIARIDRLGAVNTSTSFLSTAGNAYVRSNIRGACSVDGTSFWASGTSNSTTGGVRYLTLGQDNIAGTQISTTVTNTRGINIFNGQLYVSSQSATFRISTVGTGTPTTTGQTITNLNGIPTASTSPIGFIFFDRDATVVGDDLLYIACQSTTSGDIGLYKYSFDGTSWTARGSITTNAQLNGITGFVNCAGEVELYITRATSGTAVPIELRKFVDVAAYNATVTNNGGDFINASVSTLLATAAANYGFRGIAFTPASGLSVTTSTTAAGSYNTIIVKNGGILTLTADVNIVNKLVIENGGKLVTNGFNVNAINGGAFELQSGGTLSVSSADGITTTGNTGNIRTCSRIFTGTATYMYEGNIAQVTGNALPATIDNLVIDNTNVNGVTLSNAVAIATNLNLKNGIVQTTNTNLLTLASTANITSIASTLYTNLPIATYSNYGTTSSYVVGPIRKLGLTNASYFGFPVGSSTTHRPLFLHNANGNFTIEYSNSNPRLINNTMSAGLDHISAMEYWRINSTSTTPLAQVDLTYYDPNSGGVTNTADLRVARYLSASTNWQEIGGISTYGTPGTNGEVLSNLIGGFNTFFTLASSTALNPLPVKDINLSYSYVNNAIKLQWKVLGDAEVQRYEVEQNTNTAFNTVQTINAQRTITTAYYQYSTAPTATNIIYRIKAILLNGSIAYSNTIFVPTKSTNSLVVFNNPIKETLQFYTSFAKGNITLIDALGKVILQQYFVEGTNVLNTSLVPTGIYTLRLRATDGQLINKRIMKQ